MPPGHLSVENNCNKTARHIVYAIYKSKLDTIELVIHFTCIHRLIDFLCIFQKLLTVIFVKKSIC